MKRRCIASLPRSAPHPLLYMSMTKDYIRCICTELRQNRSGLYVRASSVSVSFGMLLQAAQAVFVPHPRNCEGVSHPVGLWKKGSVNAFNGPILERMVYIGMSRYVFSCTKATHSFDRARDSKHLTANTTTSLSTVRTYAFVWPCSAACARCRRILVSASEWLHGRSVVTWSVREHSLKSGTQEEFSTHIILGYLCADE